MKILLLILASLALAVGAVWVLAQERAEPLPPDIARAEAQFEAQWRKVEAMGLDVSIFEPPQRSVADADNAAKLLHGVAGGVDQDLNEAAWRGDKPTLADFDAYSAHLTLAREAAGKPHFYISPTEHKLVYASALNDGVTDLVTLLSRRAEALAAAGRADEALDDFEAAVRLVRLNAEDEWAKQYSKEDRQWRAISKGILRSASRLKATHLRQLEGVIKAAPSGSLQDEIRRAFLMDLYTLRNLAIFGGGKTVVELEGTQELFLKMEQAELKEKRTGPPTDPYDRALTAGYLQAVLPLLQLGEEDLRSALLNLEAAIPEDSSGAFLRSGHSIVADSIWTVFQSQVPRNQLLAALGVLRHRAETGRWPASLKEAGAVVLDPYNGRPLGWRQEGKGFRIWSVGFNRKDNGGATQTEAREGNDDQVLIYPEPPPLPAPPPGTPPPVIAAPSGSVPPPPPPSR